MRWCCQNEHIKEYFVTIKKDMPEIREGALNNKVIDGKPIDPIFLATTSNKLFEPLGRIGSQ